MKICVAQTKPVKGNIGENIAQHKNLIELALANGAGMIIFPELSITGYEPALAAALATTADDSRFNDFQKICDDNLLTIGIGIPTRNETGIAISMLIFQPGQKRTIYSKKYLHPDEEPYFISGQNFPVLAGTSPLISFAICYELSVPEHAANAVANGACIYIASVAKTAAGMEKASTELAAIAAKYSMTVLLSNCVGYCDNFQSAGGSAIWNNKGVLLNRMDDTQEGILMIDTVTQHTIKKILPL